MDVLFCSSVVEETCSARCERFCWSQWKRAYDREMLSTGSAFQALRRSCRERQDRQWTCSCSSAYQPPKCVYWANLAQSVSSTGRSRRCIGLLARRTTTRESVSGVLQGRSQVRAHYPRRLAAVLGLRSSPGQYLRSCCWPWWYFFTLIAQHDHERRLVC